MKLKLFQVDAFTSRVFGGNPAAVVPLDRWPADAAMQSIAAENNLAETAFFVPGGPDGADFDLRWFTPAVEVDLCGHATIASAHVLFRHLGFKGERIRFNSRSGPLGVFREGDRLYLDFPARPPEPRQVTDALAAALGARPSEALAARDLLAVFDHEEQVRALRPDFPKVAALDTMGVVATAPAARNADFVSRFFAPRVGINEDPVTGSTHCELIPYWSKRLGKDDLRALQVSARGGELQCGYLDAARKRVKIGGQAVTYLVGEIEV